MVVEIGGELPGRQDSDPGKSPPPAVGAVSSGAGCPGEGRIMQSGTRARGLGSELAMGGGRPAARMATPVGTSSAGSTDEAEGVLFREGFDDDRLPGRGWDDGRAFVIARDDARAGDGCIAYRWKEGATTPEGSSALRRLFEPTDTVYVRFFLRLSRGWGWSGRPYHPHLIQLLTTENARYHGPAASHLTVYIEPQEGRLRLSAQDVQNRDAPHGLTQGPLRGGYNGTFYDSKDELFADDAWHCVEAMFRLNSLDRERGRPHADGVV